MRSCRPIFGVDSLNLCYFLALLDAGLILTTFSPSTINCIATENTGYYRPDCTWPALPGSNALEAPPWPHGGKGSNQEKTTESRSYASVLRSTPPVPNDKSDSAHFTLDGGHELDLINDIASPHFATNLEMKGSFETSTRLLLSLKENLKRMADPVYYVDINGDKQPFSHLLSYVLNQSELRIKLRQVNVELPSLEELAVKRGAKLVRENTLQALKNCLIQLHEISTVNNQPLLTLKQETFVFMVLEFLFKQKLIASEKIIDFLRTDEIMCLIVRNARLVILPLKFFEELELHASWQELLTTNAQLPYLHDFLQAFDRTDWSRFLLHFFIEHYENRIDDKKSQIARKISVIVRKLKSVRDRQSTQNPPAQLITQEDVQQTIKLFDGRIHGVTRSSISNYVTSYHLLGYMLEYASPKLTYNLMKAEVMKESIWVKRATLRAMMYLAERTVVFNSYVKKIEDFERRLNTAGTAAEQTKIMDQLTYHYQILLKVFTYLASQAYKKFDGLEVLAPFTTKSPSLHAWFNSELNRTIEDIIRHRIQFSIMRFKKFLESQPQRISQAQYPIFPGSIHPIK